MMLLRWFLVLMTASLACCAGGSSQLFNSAIQISIRPSGSQLLECPAGQRCCGRNYNGRRCCTPEQPCGEGEGDCDGPGDGGGHDGHAGCRGDLQCGSNNCKQFGAFYHPKDDCCERAGSSSGPSLLGGGGGWAEWGSWSSCNRGSKTRTRLCSCSGCCRNNAMSQTRFCSSGGFFGGFLIFSCTATLYIDPFVCFFF